MAGNATTAPELSTRGLFPFFGGGVGLDRRNEGGWQPQSPRTRWWAGLTECQETWPHRPCQAPLLGLSGGTKSQQGLRITFPGGRWAGWGESLLHFPRELWSVTAMTTLLRRCPSILPFCPGCFSSLSPGGQGCPLLPPWRSRVRGKAPRPWHQQTWALLPSSDKL